MLYSVSALPWPTTDISYSIVPDGTSWNTYANTQSESVWYQTLNGLTDQQTWQRYVATAFQSWANHSNLNFQNVSDDGVAYGHSSINQGDIRIGSIDAGTADGWAFFPAGGLGGDVTIRSDSAVLTEKYWSEIRLISLLTHEIGHALGLHHSDVYGTVMGGGGSAFLGLAADDIAGIQALYGVREHDAFDTAASNDTVSTASQLQFDSTNAIGFRADLTSYADVDHYRVTVPVGGESITVSADARQLSLLAPKVQVFDAANQLVAEASGDYGTVATVRIDGLHGGGSYTVVVDGATDDVFQMGAYQLAINAVVDSPEGEPIADTVQKTEREAAPITEPAETPTSVIDEDPPLIESGENNVDYVEPATPTDSSQSETLNAVDPAEPGMSVEQEGNHGNGCCCADCSPLQPTPPSDSPRPDNELPVSEVISTPVPELENQVVEVAIQNPVQIPDPAQANPTVATQHDSDDHTGNEPDQTDPSPTDQANNLTTVEQDQDDHPHEPLIVAAPPSQPSQSSQPSLPARLSRLRRFRRLLLARSAVVSVTSGGTESVASRAAPAATTEPTPLAAGLEHDPQPATRPEASAYGSDQSVSQAATTTEPTALAAGPKPEPEPAAPPEASAYGSDESLSQTASTTEPTALAAGPEPDPQPAAPPEASSDQSLSQAATTTEPTPLAAGLEPDPQPAAPPEASLRLR